MKILDLYNNYKDLQEEFKKLTLQRDKLKHEESQANPQLRYTTEFSEEFQRLNTEWFNKYKEIVSVMNKIIELLDGKIIKLPNNSYLIPIVTNDNSEIMEMEEIK